MVESSKKKIEDDLDQLFYNEWLDKLARSSVFSKSDSQKLVKQTNVSDLINALELQLIVKPEELTNLLSFYENKQAPFSVFYKDIIKLMD